MRVTPPQRMRAPAVATLALCCIAPGSAHATCQLGRFDLPVTMRGPFALVTVGINGHEARLLADSGSFFSALTAAGAAQLKLSVGPPDAPIFTQGVGGGGLASVTRVRQFALGGASMSNVEFMVSANGPPGTVGVLGDNVLGLYDTEFDLAHGVIRLVRTRDCGHTDLAYWASAQPHSRIDIDWSRESAQPPRGTAFLDGKPIRVLFDTGATHSILSLRAAARAGVKPDSPGVVPGGQLHGFGPHAVQSWIAAFDSFRIGDEEILHTHLRMGDLAPGDADMLLGADFFLSHHVFLSASQQRVYFTYNGGPVFDLAPAPPADH